MITNQLIIIIEPSKTFQLAGVSFHFCIILSTQNVCGISTWFGCLVEYDYKASPLWDVINFKIVRIRKVIRIGRVSPTQTAAAHAMMNLNETMNCSVAY